MRICIFTPHAPGDIGGAERATDGLARHLQRVGVDLTVLAPAQARPFEAPYPICAYQFTAWRRRWPSFLVKPVKQLYQQKPFDLLVALYGYPTGYAAVLAGEKLNLPVIILSQGGDIYENASIRSKPLRWRRNIYAYEHADALITISPYVEDILKSLIPLPLRMEYIPNGIEIDEFDVSAPRPTDFTDPRPFLLCLGNLRAVKGFQFALTAFAKVKSQLGGVSMVVVGSGEMEQELKAQTAHLGLSNDVIFMGRKTGSDKAWFIQNCRYGIMPSLEEAHAVVGLEFLCAGKPVIATHCPAFDRTFDHGINSLRVPLKDPDAIADAMIRMQEIGPESFSRACRTSAEAFDWKALAPKYVHYFEQVIKSYKGRR